MHIDVIFFCNLSGHLVWRNPLPSLALQVELLLWDGPRAGHAEVLPMHRGDAGSWSVKVNRLPTTNAAGIHGALHPIWPIHHFSA